MRIRILGGAVLAVALSAMLAGCAATSLDSVAENCGGSSAGVNADDTGVMITLGNGSDAFVCVVQEVFPDKDDQYEVSLVAEKGVGQSSTVDGREVKTGELGGSAFVFIGAK